MNKNIENKALTEAMEEAKIYNNIIKENSEASLVSAVLKETNDLFEVSEEDETEDEVVSFGDEDTDVESGNELGAGGAEDDIDLGGDADVDDVDANFNDSEDTDEEFGSEDVEGINNDPIDLGGDGDAEVLPIDMTQEPVEDVIKVFKKMTDDDEIEVVGDKVVINDPESNNEYQIEVPGMETPDVETDFEGEEIEGTDVDVDTEGDVNIEFGDEENVNDEDSEEEKDEIDSLLEGVYNDLKDATHSEDIDLNISDDTEDAGDFQIELNEYVGIDYETIIFLQGHEAEEALNILSNEGGDATIEYLSQWDNGDGGEIVNHDSFGTDDSMYEGDVYTIVYNKYAEYIGLYKPQEVIDEDAIISLDEQEPIVSEDPVVIKNAEEMGDKVIKENEALKAKIDLLIKENAELKEKGALLANAYRTQTEAVKTIKEGIVESQVYTTNLINITSIFLEHATTQTEKKAIVEQFNGIKSIEDSKQLKESIVKNLVSGPKSTPASLTESVKLQKSTSVVNKHKSGDTMIDKILGLM